MPLSDEGIDVWRPVAVKALDDGTYQILGPMPDDEQWAFAPGSIVSSQLKTLSDGQEYPVAILLSDEHK